MHSFEPFRVVGSVCGDAPISFTFLYGEPLLMVPTGRTFQLYKGASLRMIRGGPTYQHHIRAVAQTGKFRFVGEGSQVHAMVHHKLLWSSELEPVTQPSVVRLLAQDDLLFALGSHKIIRIFEIKTGKVLQDIPIENSETISCWCLLSGYSNKLLLGTEEGHLQLYNYHTGKCLWKGEDILLSSRLQTPPHPSGSFPPFRQSEAQVRLGTSPTSPILSITSSVYKDVVAFGTGDGRVVIFNVVEDKIITEFQHTAGSAVTSLVFRVDKDGFLVSGTSLGEVVVWDVENRCMDGLLTRTKEVRTLAEVVDLPHSRAVHSLIVFPPPSLVCASSTTAAISAAAVGRLAPLLVCGGADNALVQFRFDTVDGLGRMVRERRGHASGCTTAAFFNQNLLLTAGADRTLRVTHVFSDRASWELSQGKLGKRVRETSEKREVLQLPPAVVIASSTIRNYQWSSVVTLHESSAFTCGWRMDNKIQDFKLSGIQTSSHTARSIALSDCGNYAVVGYSSGHAVIINLQNRSVRHLFDPCAWENEEIRSLKKEQHQQDNSTLGSRSALLSSSRTKDAKEAVGRKFGRGEDFGLRRCHMSAVETIQIAHQNTVVITAGWDGLIKFWTFPAGEWKRTIATHIPITKSCLHSAASLFFAVHHHRIDCYHGNPDIIVETQEEQQAPTLPQQSDISVMPIRSFVGHTSAITALAIAPDSYRYVVSTSADAMFLIWDIAAAVCVGQYRFASPATSVSFHPDALFLLTTHAGERGAFLWSNNLRYGFVPEVISHPERVSLEDVPILSYPKSHGSVEEEKGLEKKEVLDETEGQDVDKDGSSAEVVLYDDSKDLAKLQRQEEKKIWDHLNSIPMQGLQISRNLPSRQSWFYLTVLDQIKEKNQPLLPPKKSQLPFFLSSVSSERPTFFVQASLPTSFLSLPVPDSSAATSRSTFHKETSLLPSATGIPESPISFFQELLLAKDHEGIMQFLTRPRHNTPQEIDLHLRLAVEYNEESTEYTPEEMCRMRNFLGGLLEFVLYWLRKGKEVDFIQGIIANLLRTHVALFGRLLTGAESEKSWILPLLEDIAVEQNRIRYTMDHLVSFPHCLAGALSGTFF